MYPSFEIDHVLETRIDQESPQPNFQQIFLSHYNNQELSDLWNFIDDSDIGPHIFLKGLFLEHGIYPRTEPDKQAALQTFQRGADEKDSYCNFRLHFIYKKEHDNFNVQKDRSLEMLHLIKAAAFFDEKDNRINRKLLDPVMHLAVHLDHEDPDLIKCIELLEKYQENSENDKKVGTFLRYWCCVRFSLSEYTKDECIKTLNTIADEKDAEACYFLGEAYRYGEEFPQDFELSKKYLEIAKENGCMKALESLGYVYLYEFNKQPELSLDNFKEGAKKGLYTSLKIMGEYQIVGKFIDHDLNEGIKNLYYAYLQCDFWALLTTYEVYKYFELKEKKNLEIKHKMFELANTLFQIKGKIGKIAHIRLAYSIYSECYEKGYGVQQDLVKARAILLESLAKIEQEKLKTLIYYRLAVIAERRQEYEEANKYYDSCIRACFMMVEIEGYSLIKNQAYYNLLGKMLYWGKGTARNITKAVEYLKEGVKIQNSFYFGTIYAKKCQNLLKKIFIQKSILKITEIKQENQSKSQLIFKTSAVHDFKDLAFDLYIDKIGPVKIFYGKIKGKPIRIEEYYYSSQNNYIIIINHLIKLMNAKSSYLDKIIGIAADPKTCLISSIFEPLELKFISLEDFLETERLTEKTTISLKTEKKFVNQRSQDSLADEHAEKLRQKLSLKQKVDISLKISNAIQSLHQINIAHGNITPRKIFISPTYEVLVTGYGHQNSRLYDNDNTYKAETIIERETMKYVAPEGLQKSKDSEIQSDIWSLGCILFLIFCERSPLIFLNPEDTVQAYKKKITSDLKFIEGTPRVIQEMIKDCTKLNPQDRCSISFVIQNLQNLLN